MKTKLFLLIFIFPLLLFSATINLELTFLETDNSGYRTSPGRLRSPVHQVNVLLPKDALIQSYDMAAISQRPATKAFTELNGAFIGSDGILDAPVSRSIGQREVYLGTHRWGDMSYASFRIMPYDESSGLWAESYRLSLTYEAEPDIGRIPATFFDEDFFVNSHSLRQWYSYSRDQVQRIQVIGTNELYSALGPWLSFRQGQGFDISFSEINSVLTETGGTNPPDKLRNHLIAMYSEQPFSYVLLLGDHDLVPIAQLCPEPNGSSTVPSDFYYADLTSDWDTDNDGRLGEYYSEYGQEDYGVSYTPEAFVGRFSTNNPDEIAAIASRIVAFEQSSDPFKQKALLPAAFLNYANEPVLTMLQTDGATFSEFARQTILRDYQSTTLYEELGVVPSYPSDFPLNETNLNNLIRNEDFGIISWSAHGSQVSSSRKIWMEDYNNNGIPENYEMQWMGMVDRDSFNDIQSDYGTVIFAASCHNGYLDYFQQSLAETALAKRAVGVVAATRTGWYKVGWQNPGWGGLSSYNYHFLENYAERSYSAGAALAYTNLLHTQYYLFGDPIDDDGVIWPELQNVYTYILFGDPVLGHSEFTQPEGEILVFSPQSEMDHRLVNSIRDNADLNVIFSNRLIPDYSYLDQFEAIFCLMGDYQPSSWELELLDDYLEFGGKIYMEGNVSWDMTDPFLSKFGVEAPLDYPIIIEGINDSQKSWAYQAQQNSYFELVPQTTTAAPILYTDSCPSHVVAVLNTGDTHRSIASAFRLEEVLDAEPGTHRSKFKELIEIILVKLDVLPEEVSLDDAITPMAQLKLLAWPNPSSGNIQLKLENAAVHEQELSIYNIRGQKLKTIRLSAKDGFTQSWDGRDAEGRPCPGGIYILKTGNQSRKITLLP